MCCIVMIYNVNLCKKIEYKMNINDENLLLIILVLRFGSRL